MKITPYNNRLHQWLRLGLLKTAEKKQTEGKKLNVRADSTPLKASDRNVSKNGDNFRRKKK